MSGWRRWRVPALFAAVILLPVVLAALTLHTRGWYEPGTRSEGTGCTGYLSVATASCPSAPMATGLSGGPSLRGAMPAGPCADGAHQSALGRNLDKLELVQLTPPHDETNMVK